MADESQNNSLILERMRVEGELRLRESELQHQRKKWRWEKWSFLSPALIGLMGIVFGALLTGYSNIALEDRKLRSRLILKAIDTRDTDDALKMLHFLENLGLLTGIRHEISVFDKDPSSIPLRPTRCWDDSGWDSGWDVPKRNFGGRF